MAELRYTYLLDVKDRASRAVTTANERIARSAQQANRAMEKQGAVAQSASRQIQSAGARQAAEWKQVARAAQTAERSVAQSATQASTSVSKALERQVAAQRKAGASYAQIARAQKAAGASARETAAAIEQSAAREQKAMTASSGAARKHSGVLGGLRSQLKGFGGMAAGLGATFAAFKGLDFLRESVNDVESLARSTIKLQKITGQDATTASSWIQVAKQRGLTAQQLSRAFVTLEKNQVKGAAGAKTQAEAFRTLGISQEQLKRSNPQQLILAVADGMKNLENPSKRAAAAQALFGRAGVSLIATLSGGSQAIRDQLEVVQRYGASLDKNGVKNAMKLVAEQRKLSLAMDGVKLSIGQALVPLLARGAKALATFVLQMREGKGAGGQVRRVFEQMAQGAAGVWSAVGPAVKALAGLVRQHPGLVKVAGAFVAIGLAVRGLRFASAVSGATSLLGLLTRIGAKRGAVTGVLAGAGGGGAAGAAAGIKALSVRLLGLVGVYAVARAAVDKFTAKMTASSNPVVSAYGKVQNVVQRLGRAFMGDRQGLTDYFQALFSGATKVHPKLRQTAADAAQVRKAFSDMARGTKVSIDIAGPLARESAKAGKVTAGMVRGIVNRLTGLPPAAQKQAARTITQMVAVMERMGTAPAGSARRIVGEINRQWPTMQLKAAGATRATVQAMVAGFGGLAAALEGPFARAQARFLTFLRNMQSTADRVRNTANLTGLPGQGARRRKGGYMFGTGGVVPAMVSPGEMIVHQGRAGMVPGAPVAADNVAMMLPVGAAVLTGDGQRMVSQGATIGQAIARQAPHFQAGGHVRGKLSWFGGPRDSQDSGRTALGLTTATPGVAVRPGATWQTGRATLGAYWRVRTPNGRTAVLRQTDLGPNESTGRRIDLTYSALGRLGYNEGNFPTDRVGVADLVGGGAARAAAYRLSGYAAALARRVGASRIRSGILPDAFEQGIQQGEAGMTRARLRAMGDPVYRAISAAYRVPGDKVVRVAGRAAPTSGGGGRGWRGVGQSGLGGRIAGIAGRVMGAFPGLQVTSTTGGQHAKNSWHYKGRAVDLAGGNMNAAARWVWRNVRRSLIEGIHNPNLSVAGGKGVPASYWGPSTWAGHANHIHLAARRGGIARFQAGGRVPRYAYATPGERGRVIRGDEFGVYSQPSRGMGAVLGGAMFPVVHASNQAFAKRFAALNAAIQNAALDKLAALRRGLTGAVRRGGSELAVKRMQQAIDLVDRELGRRIGLLSRRIASRAAAADTRVTRTDIGLRIRGVNPDSPAAITERLGAERFRGDALHRTGRDLAKQLRLAERARNLAKITEIRQEIADNQTAILDSRANQAELARARAEQIKADRNAVYEYVADMAGSKTNLAQSGLQTLELRQRLAGTYDTGGQARADYIRSQIVPDLQAEQAAVEQQRQEAVRQGNQQLAAQLAEALAAKQNEVLQAQLDAQEATAENTAATADAIKSLGGTLGFEFGGSRLTDALLASGVGA